jgi:hypothetical protein
MDGVRMALATGEILHCLNASLINKEAKKRKYDEVGLHTC